MTRQKLPPLAALRGFDAAARHLSFTLAAEELRLTQGAVSRQVRQLETFLEIDLFERHTRRIVLTDAGEEFFKVVSDLMDRLEETTARIQRRSGVRTVTVSVLPTIASSWLMPRLHLFAERCPGIEVRLHTSIEPVTFGVDGPDLAIRVGRLPGKHYGRDQPRVDLEMVRDWRGIHLDPLFPDRLVPVCHRSVLGGADTIPVSDLVRFPLIHTSSRRFAWPDWLRAHGLTPPDQRAPSHEFGHFFMSLNAAKRGQGIALLPDIILHNESLGDSLVIPVPADIDSAGDYALLVPDSDLDRPTVEAFRSWLLDERGRMQG